MTTNATGEVSSSVDEPSLIGQFGWERIGTNDNISLPVILRSDGLRYCAVRMVEQEIIRKFENLPQAVFQCIVIRSFYLTLNEAKLLSAINFNHCNHYYGESFFTPKDVILSAQDVKSLLRYLNISHRIFNNELSHFKDSFGIVRLVIDTQNHNFKMLVPFIGKKVTSSADPVVRKERFVSLKLVEKYVNLTRTTLKSIPSDWDVMYLKMLSIYCGNNSQQFISTNDSIVNLDSLLYPNKCRLIYEDVLTLQCQPPHITNNRNNVHI